MKNRKFVLTAKCRKPANSSDHNKKESLEQKIAEEMMQYFQNISSKTPVKGPIKKRKTLIDRVIKRKRKP